MVITFLELLTLADVQAFDCCTMGITLLTVLYNYRLKSYSLKLEAQAKELENSNRILRMKVVGSDDAVYHNKVNTNDNVLFHIL
jgi:hypothetical protein